MRATGTARASRPGTVEVTARREGEARFGEIVVDFDGMEIRRSGRVVHATYLEFRLLRLFVDNPRRVFSREDLMRSVWPRGRRHTVRTVDTSIWRLRQKLEKHPSHPTYLQTVRHVGYKFVPSQPRE